jgi:hypothetical protein
VNERDLGKALLHWEAERLAAPPDPHEMTRRVLRRDQKRVKLLTAVAVLFWVLAAGGIFLLVYLFFTALSPKLAWMARNPERIDRELSAIWVTIANWSVALFAVSFGVLLLAAVSTVVLVLASRRATLRQVNASLVEISDQLRKFAEALGTSSRT